MLLGLPVFTGLQSAIGVIIHIVINSLILAFLLIDLSLNPTRNFGLNGLRGNGLRANLGIIVCLSFGSSYLRSFPLTVGLIRSNRVGIFETINVVLHFLGQSVLV